MSQFVFLFSGGTGDSSQTTFMSDTYTDGLLLIPKNSSRTIEIQANFSTYAKTSIFKFGIASIETKQGLGGNISGLPVYSSNISLKGSSAAAPTISITSPQGGQTLTKGSTVTISWSGGFGDGKDEIRLISSANYPTQLIEGNYSAYTIKADSDISSSSNSYSWTIPDYILAGQYIIRILREDPATLNAVYYDDTNSFITIQ